MRIRNDLQARGFECELIERKTAQNLDIDKVIKTIEAADCIIALLSTSYEYEKICQFEIVYGYKLGKILLPIAVQNKYKPDYWLEEIFARSRVPECRLPSIKKDLAYVERDLELIAKIVPANREQEVSSSLLCSVLWMSILSLALISVGSMLLLWVCVNRRRKFAEKKNGLWHRNGMKWVCFYHDLLSFSYDKFNKYKLNHRYVICFISITIP